ncbi:MAG: MFS transporter [Verrucomicrobiota bacterium]|nr:MFS transporter [Verrucomicrobiota bacterium]MCC6821720.1 MFS transporter [Limisphaerales bacterium]
MNGQHGLSPSRYAWTVVGLLWPVVVLNYLDRQMLSTMRLSIKVDITELQSAEYFGWLMAIFLWIYALCSPLGGAVADRFNRKWLIITSLGVWSLVTLLMGVAANYHQLFALRAIMGVSEALYMPAGLALIADYHHGPTRSLAVGVHLSGVYLGQALGGIGGWVAQEISWRAAFVGCGALGVAYALVLMIFLHETNRGRENKTSSTPAASPAVGVDWRGFVILILCFSLPSLSGWAVKNWLPTLLQDRFGLAQAPSGLWATFTHAGPAFCGVIVGGWLADRWFQRNVRGRTYLSSLGLALLVPGILIIGLAPGFPMAIAGSVLYGFGFGMFDANNMPILCQLAPARFRATGYGLLNFFGIASGAALTPLLGKLKDSGVPLAVGFAYCAIPALLAAILMYVLRPTSRDRGEASAL